MVLSLTRQLGVAEVCALGVLLFADMINISSHMYI